MSYLPIVETNQNTAAHVTVFCIKALPIAPTLSLQLESEYTFVFLLSLAIFIYFVSLNLKAMLVKAGSGVFNTELGISPNYRLTTASNYSESHRQFVMSWRLTN